MPTSKRKRRVQWLAVVGLLLVVGYPLSFGLAMALASLDCLPPGCNETLVLVYAPLIWLMERNDTVGEWSVRYWGWCIWIVDPGSEMLAP